MAKFLRTYTLRVQGRSGQVHSFSDPLTVIFDIDRAWTGSSPNSGHFMLFNLDPEVASDLEYDAAIDVDGDGTILQRPFVFNGGYVTEGFEPVVFQGDLYKVFTYRDGPETITDITVNEGLVGMQLAQIASTTAYPWDPKAEVVKMVKLMQPYGVTLGGVGSLFTGYQPKRGTAWVGAVWDNLKALATAAKGGVSLSDRKIYVVGPNDVLAPPSSLPVLNANTGLIDTPRRTAYTVTAQMIFEPRIVLGQQIALESKVSPRLNGTYAIWRAGHRGTISGAKDGGVITGLELRQQTSPFFQVAVE